MQPAETTDDVYSFNDYRSFLASHAARLRLARPRWSYGAWARQLGLAGTASLTMVLNGQRRAGPQLVGKLIGYFKFDRRAAAYFRGLVRLESARTDPDDYLATVERLRRANPARTVQFLEEDAFELVANWHYYAIRELTLLADFVDDPFWISSRLGGRVAPSTVRAALRRLVSTGLLRRSDDGTLTPGTATVAAGGGGMASAAIRRFHGQVLQLAERAIEGEPTARRVFAASTLSVRGDAVPQVEALFQRFQDELAKLCESEAGSDVYQFSLQFIPLTAPAKAVGRASKITQEA